MKPEQKPNEQREEPILLSDESLETAAGGFGPGSEADEPTQGVELECNGTMSVYCTRVPCKYCVQTSYVHYRCTKYDLTINISAEG